MLVRNARDAGELSAASHPLDLLRAIGGIASVSPDADGKVSAERLVDVLLLGLCPQGDLGSDRPGPGPRPSSGRS